MENWIPAPAAWAAFCERNPGLGLSGSKNSFIWFIRTHGAALQAGGHLRKALTRKWLANVDTFDQAVFELLSQGN